MGSGSRGFTVLKSPPGDSMCIPSRNHWSGAPMLSVLAFLSCAAVTWSVCWSGLTESSARAGGACLAPWPQHTPGALWAPSSSLSVWTCVQGWGESMQDPSQVSEGDQSKFSSGF